MNFYIFMQIYMFTGNTGCKTSIAKRSIESQQEETPVTVETGWIFKDIFKSDILSAHWSLYPKDG